MSRTDDSYRYFGRLIDHALSVRGDLFALDVIRTGEPVVLELTPEAGRRLSALLLALPMSAYPVLQSERIKLLEGYPARREATVGGVTFRWEVFFVATRDGKAIPEPLPFAETLSPAALSELGHG